MDFDQKLKEIANLREQKGKEHETLDLIDQTEGEAIEEENNEVLVKLNWERALVWQHVAMNEEAKETPDDEVLNDAISKMEQVTLEADKMILANNLLELKPMSYRNLAQVYRYKKDYDRAASAYQAAIDEFEKANSVSSLELKGFLAATMVMQGKTQEGIDLSLQTFDALETNPLAVDLKQKDYVTWAIWKSGIIPRLVRALHETGAEYDKNKISEYLTKSSEILSNPTGQINWGDNKFQFRVDEISKAKSLLTIILSLLVQVLSFVTIGKIR